MKVLLTVTPTAYIGSSP